MRATGIIRRIDDLGRVVIPREIRRNLGIRDGDPLEVFTHGDGSITFKKYSVLGDIENKAKNATDALIACGIEAAIFDNLCEYISGDIEMKRYRGALISDKDNRTSWDVTKDGSVVCTPILSDGEVAGYIVYDATGAANREIVKPIAKMLGFFA